MGIISHGESPWGWAPTICFGMAADAINVSETTYKTAVRYYLANLGTTMESQVRSSVSSLESVASPVSTPTYRFLTLLSVPLHLAVCRASLFSELSNVEGAPSTQVTACQSRTRILAVTSDLTSYQIPDDRVRREDSSGIRTQ